MDVSPGRPEGWHLITLFEGCVAPIAKQQVLVQVEVKVASAGARAGLDQRAGARVGEIHPANQGDTQTLPETFDEAREELENLDESVDVIVETGKEIVSDKGTHSGAVLVAFQEEGIRTYISEPDRGPRKWTGKNGIKTEGKEQEHQATYANRRRIRGERGWRLLRRRGEVLERAFAHLLDTGGMPGLICVVAKTSVSGTRFRQQRSTWACSCASVPAQASRRRQRSSRSRNCSLC